jgi:hypothetical protein
MYDEFGRMWKEAVVSYCEALFPKSPEETEEYHENPHSC